ncbi:hypothetical protein PG637_09150 [Riemerella anatipestifer]|nr:hypothetical protein [Riemerella anatipestifer]MDY3325830.1 hypothetical protein [Riemerella anatipestifer]MDY3354372.1 hypothetical protein [Riemerella anatipestifer]
MLIGLSFLLSLIAFVTRDLLLSFAATYILEENISLQEGWKLSAQIFPFVLFVISVGIIPFLFTVVDRICALRALNEKIFSVVLIVSTGFVFLFSRVMFLRFKKNKIDDLLQRVEFSQGAEIPSVKFEDMNLEVFLIIGLLVGTIISILIFRKNSYITENICDD